MRFLETWGYLFVCSLLIASILGSQSDPEAGLVGSRAKKLSLMGLQEESVDVPSFPVGIRYNIVVFWSTWNRFAVTEFEDLNKRYARWSRSGVRIVGINVESSRIGREQMAAARKWLGQHPASFPIVFDKGLKAFRAYGVIAVPTTFVIDDSGTIVMKIPGYPVGGASELIKYIETRIFEDREGGARTPTKVYSQSYRWAVRHLRQARYLIRKGKIDLAFYTLNLVIQRDPALLDARIELIRLFERSGKKTERALALRKAQKDFPDSARLMVESARVAFSMGDMPEAEALASRALAINPSLSPAQMLLGKIREKQGKQTKALDHYLHAAEQNVLDASPLLEAGRIYETQQRFKESLDCYERAYLLLDGRWTR